MKKRSEWLFQGATPNSREFLDMDYVGKLNKKEREWLLNFVKAEYLASHESAEKIKGGTLTMSEKKKLNAQNNRRVRDAHNKLDRRSTAGRILQKSDSSDETQDLSSEGREE